jgi:Domain of unknown function (DUF4260)
MKKINHVTKGEMFLNKILLHIEGLAIFILSVYVYSYFEFSWLLFFLLLLVPDLSMLGYLLNNQVGAFSYNLFHTYSFPIVFLLLGVILSIPFMLNIGLIWSAHIGMDRFIGYGLKYPTNFKDTHFQRI